MLRHTKQNVPSGESKRKEQKNYAFIDSNNVYLGVKNQGWTLDYSKLRRLLKDKYGVEKAYIFIGYIEAEEELYKALTGSGFELIYRPTLEYKIGEETVTKGNVDTELVLQALIEIDHYDGAVIVSGDGDFYALVKYLKSRNKLEKLMVPNRNRYSALLREFASDIVSLTELKGKVELKRRPKEESKEKEEDVKMTGIT